MKLNKNRNISTLRNSLWNDFKALIPEICPIEILDSADVHGSFGYDSSVINQILNCDNDDNWLGSYSPMRSPGKIRLNRRKILEFSKYILKENISLKPFGYPLNCNDAKRILKMIFDMVLYHELFHYFCDVMIPFENHKNTNVILEEEALAVAFSYLYAPDRVNFYSSFNKYKFKELYFDRIAAPGYRDWVLFNRYNEFYYGLSKYILLDPSVVNYYESSRNLSDDQRLEHYSKFQRMDLLLSSIITNPNIEFILV